MLISSKLKSALLAVTLAASGAFAESPPEPKTLLSMDSLVRTGEVTPVAGISSSGQPDKEALAVLAAAGYAAVIDLRGANENRGLDEQSVVEELGMRYLNLPISGAKGVNFDNARALDALLAEFDEPVLIHCGSGNRVGALLALRKNLAGASLEESVSTGKDAGLTKLEPHVRKVLAETKTDSTQQ